MFYQRPFLEGATALVTELILLIPVAITRDVPYVDQHFWSKAVSTDWWNHIVMQTWIQNFPMKKQMFLELCECPNPLASGHP